MGKLDGTVLWTREHLLEHLKASHQYRQTIGPLGSSNYTQGVGTATSANSMTVSFLLAHRVK